MKSALTKMPPRELGRLLGLRALREMARIMRRSIAPEGDIPRTTKEQ
jgi:hypothetical protein